MSVHSHRSVLIKLIVLLAFLTGIVLARSAGPDLGKTGGFGEPNCTECHRGAAVNSPGGTLTLEGLPERYTPNTDYPLTVRISRSGQSRWGFQLAARFLPAPNNQAGAFRANDGLVQVQTNGSTGVQYVQHTSAGTFRGQAGSGSWTFTWRSPGPGSGSVQLNVAANAANNDGTNQGDFIYTREVVVAEAEGQPAACNQPNNTYFAQFANGGAGLNFVSKVILTNPGSSAVDACMEFKGDNGAPLAVNMSADPPSINPAGTFSIPPNGTVVFISDGRGDLAVGSVRVGSSGQIGGVVLFSFTGGGTTGVGASAALSGFIAPVERNADVNTGLALANTGDAPVTVNLSLRRLDGTEAGVAPPINLPARGHSQGFINDYFGDGVTTNFRGSVVARVVGGNVGGTALRIGNEFTTLPVTPLP